MFSIDRVKEEVTDENSEMSLPNSTEIKIEVKMEEIDPSGVTNYDNDILDPDCAKIETDDVDIEDLYVKDEFDREIVKQELENNDAALSSPVVVVGSSGTTQNLPSKKLVIVPKKVYLDMKKKKKKTKEIEKNTLFQYKTENAVLSLELTSLKNKYTRSNRTTIGFKKHIKLLESRVRHSEAKIKGANLMSKRLQDKIDELQTQVSLLSSNNAKLEELVESLSGKNGARRRTKAAKELDRNREKVESNINEILAEDGEPSVEVLKQAIVSLVKEKNLVKVQLDKKTAELKRTQTQYGNTMIALSAERRKTQELKKNMNMDDKEKKKIPFVWTVRK